MSFSIQGIIGCVLGILLALFGVGLLTPESGLPQTQMSETLAALITALGVALIGASILSGTGTVKGQKLWGLSVEASGGIALFVITLAFIATLSQSDPGAKSGSEDKGGNGGEQQRQVQAVHEYQTYCDQCCANYYPNLPAEQCPIRGVGISSNESLAMDRAVEQCVQNGGSWEGCGRNLVKVSAEE